MNFIMNNIGNIVVGAIIFLVLIYAVRNIIKNFGHCGCNCAKCPKEISKDCHCHEKEDSVRE